MVQKFTQRMDRRIPALLAALAVIAIALMICAQQLRHEDWFAGTYDELIRYPYLMEQFRKQIDAGIWYPRWLYDLYSGYGYPTFLIYQPGYWFFSLPFTYLTGSFDEAAKLSNCACILLAFSGYYLMARHFGNSRVVSLCLTLAASISIIWFKASAISLASSQRFAYAFSIWALYLLFSIHRRIQEKKPHLWLFCCWCALSFAVLFTHPFIGGFYMALCGAITAGFWLQGERYSEASRYFRFCLIICMILMVTLSSPYWFTGWYFSDKVDLHLAHSGALTPRWQFNAHGSPISGFIFWHFGEYHPSFIESGMYLIIALAFYTLRKERWIVPVMSLYMTMLFLMLPCSLPVWEHVPILQYMQMPYRVKFLNSLIEYIVLCNAMKVMSPYLTRITEQAVLVVMAGLCLYVYQPFASTPSPFLPQASHIDFNQKKEQVQDADFVTFQGIDTFRPLSAHPDGLKNRKKYSIPLFMLATDGTQNKSDLHIETHNDLIPPFTASLDIPKDIKDPVELDINQLYLPGWGVRINGEPLELNQPTATNGATLLLSPHGTMRLHFTQPGHYDISAQYSGPPYWQARNSIITIITLIALWLYRRRTYAWQNK